MNHLLQCTCGKLKGFVSHPEKGNRGVCYCQDCQTFAHFLGRSSEILDKLGGTDVIQTLPKYVTFTDGIEVLTCVRLTEHGLLRWYASCCNTPIGNTLANFKISFVGLVHNCLENSSGSLEDSFGPVCMQVNTKGAKGKPKSMLVSTVAAVFRFMAALIRARLDGSYKYTPFFDVAQGTPIVIPRVLSPNELARARNAV